MAKPAATKTKEKTKTEVDSSKGAVSNQKLPRAEVWARELEEAIRQTDSGYLSQARLLHEGYVSTYASDLGYDKGGFEELLEKRFGMKYTKAMYFIRIQAKLLELEIKPSTVEMLPWSKLREIIPVLDKENSKEWVDKAKKSSVEDLHKQVTKSRQRDQNAPVITTMKFKFPEDTVGFVEEALSKGREMLNEDGATKIGDAEVLSHICAEWLEYKGVSPEKISMEDMAAWAKRIWGEHADVTTEDVEAEAEDLSDLDDPDEPEEDDDLDADEPEEEEDEPEEEEIEEEEVPEPPKPAKKPAKKPAAKPAKKKPEPEPEDDDEEESDEDDFDDDLLD